jgi:hypothetical protein
MACGLMPSGMQWVPCYVVPRGRPLICDDTVLWPVLVEQPTLYDEVNDVLIPNLL